MALMARIVPMIVNTTNRTTATGLWLSRTATMPAFTTPAMHRVHHSRRPEETDTNYSNIFSVWDRLFGTYPADPSAVQTSPTVKRLHDLEESRS